MAKQGKVWGETEKIFGKNNVEIHRIEVKSGGWCSKHMHAHKWNSFFVESGKIEIHEYQNDYDLVDITVLESGETSKVPPGIYHKFHALEDTICYEIYWVALDDRDIIREDIGGIEEDKFVPKTTSNEKVWKGLEDMRVITAKEIAAIGGSAMSPILSGATHSAAPWQGGSPEIKTSYVTDHSEQEIDLKAEMKKSTETAKRLIDEWDNDKQNILDKIDQHPPEIRGAIYKLISKRDPNGPPPPEA
jgi:mannose-6-phosphate isomerase-like protein (cupin superfamily)